MCTLTEPTPHMPFDAYSIYMFTQFSLVLLCRMLDYLCSQVSNASMGLCEIYFLVNEKENSVTLNWINEFMLGYDFFYTHRLISLLWIKKSDV